MPPTKPPKLSHEIMNQSTLCSITRPWTSKPRPTVPKQSKKVKPQGQKKMPLKSQENIISEYQISLKSKMEHRDHKEYRGDKELKGDRDQGLRPKKSIQAKNGDEILKCQERIGFWGHRGKLSNGILLFM